MEEVRQLVQEEGREARNLVAFHVAVDSPTRVSRKPPRAVPPARRAPPRAVRLRSASAGRDKRSDMRARYWALLFGDLHRSVGEIYNFVDANENVNECQEVILVLENYTRDFKALGEWFRLKWEYDNTPPPQRPQSLAWEIRKTDFVRLDFRRAYSAKSSPSVSGKNSPCLSGHNTPSGKNSPNLTGKASPGSGKISPRIATTHSSTSPKANIEFFSSKIVASKITAKPEPKTPKETTRLSDIKERDLKDTQEDNQASEAIPEINNVKEIVEKDDPKNVVTVEVGKAKEIENRSPKQVVIKSPKYTITQNAEIPMTKSDNALSSQAKATIAQLDAIENAFLEKHLNENSAKNENMLNKDKEIENKLNQLNNELTDVKNLDTVTNTELSNGNGVEVVENNIVKDDELVGITKQELIDTEEKRQSPIESPTKSEDHFADISNDSSPKFNEEKPPDVILNAEINEHKSQLDQPEIVKDLLTDIQKDKKQDNENDMKTDTSDKINEVNNDKLKKGVKEPDLTSSNDTVVKEESKKEQDLKKSDNKNITDLKQSARPAYSTAAAKPKSVNQTKTEVKTPLRSNTLARSSTVVELRSNTVSKTQKPFQRKNQTNKCSYPFNLTTGRKSLFDNSPTVNKAPLIKRPFNRNTSNMASGDNKMSTLKPDVKKRPPRPTSLKIIEKGDKKTKIEKNPALQRIKDCDKYSSSDTIVTQIDMSRIDSSESLKTLVPEDMIQDVGNSIEVLAIDDKKDNEGWLTVKSKRCTRESKKQSKSHWANRFHQPSATTSLPTLNMLVSPKQESKSVTDAPTVAKIDRAQSEQPQTSDTAELEKVNVELKPNTSDQIQTVEKLEPKVVKVTAKSKSQEKPKDLAMIRQKSDVTGLRTRSSKSKVLTKRAEKVKDASKDDGYSDLTKNRLHSSLESLTTGLARSQESTEESFDFDKWKAEFKSTFNFLEDDDQISDQNELLMSADPSEMSEIAEMTSQIEENERKISLALDFQSEVDQRKLCEEEDLLNRQIMELQQVSDIDLDTETDDTETDAEILCEDPISVTQCPPESLGSLTASLEDQYETALAGMSWAERMDALVTLEALVARDPGRAQQLHSKLSQGIRRRGSLQDVLRRIQAKQARADRQRQQLRTERAGKIHQLLARVEEVKLAKNQLTEEKRLRMERRLQKAAENRDQHLKDRVRKAHDEEEKLREIAFIKQLEAENRRHDFLAQCRTHTTRLRQRRREQLLKLEEKAAREAAVGARRQALLAARQQHVALLLERRQQRTARVEELRELRRLQRDDAAREKAEGVKSRLSALAAAAKQEEDALRSRIRDKQDASQQRLESHLQAIREKATGPRQATTSESHDQATKDMEEADRLEQERKEREKQKTIKKKARKLRQKLLATSNTRMVYENNSLEFEAMRLPFTNKFIKIINSINNFIKPLQEDSEIESCSNGKENGCDDEQKSKKKNKKLVNGTDSSECNDKKKRKKSKDSSEREVNDTEKINGDQEPNDNDKKKRKKESSEREIELEKNNNDTEVKETKKKKKKSESDKKSEKGDKLTKTSSVCSSLSDMSRSSVRERKVAPSVDVTFLERQLNELNRIIEKLSTTVDKRQVYKTLAISAVDQVLAVAAEREDIAALFTPRCVTAAVTALCRAAGGCEPSALQLVAGNTAAHLVRLLAAHLEKDLTSDPKELELARQLTDCLSVALDAVLCASRVYDEQKTHTAENTDLVGTLRNRAHSLISYFCLSGCLSRAEKAGEARESIQTLLTVCADLCHPCDADIGSERLSARQSLRCALGSSVFGSRAEFCMLFERGAELAQCGDFVRAARTAHLLRAIAEMDHQIVQEAFGEGGWPLEFRAAVARLLSQHAPNEKEAPRQIALRLSNTRLDQTLSETMVLDLIVLVGLVVVNNPQLQETICEGWTVIKTLCTLPANWLVSRPHSSALLPTLMALAETPSARAAIAAEVNMEIVEEFMESPEAQKVKLVQIIKQAKNKKSGKK